jgi:hypothetical protein
VLFTVTGWLLLSISAGGSAGELPQPTAKLGRPVAVPPSSGILPYCEKWGAINPLLLQKREPGGRTSIHFSGPAETQMTVTWQSPDGSFCDNKNALTAPKEFNFAQGNVYRLRVKPAGERAFYPTLEVSPETKKTTIFLAHSSVPITFSADDFAQAKAGKLVVKVVYLPDPANQDFSTAFGAEEVVSTQLEPGTDPVAEAQRRGSILAIIRLGNVDLEERRAKGR